MNQPQPITQEELQGLPRWARVAMAARCVRLIQPLFREFWPNAPRDGVTVVNKATTLAERSAAARTPQAGLAETVAEAERCARAAAGVAQIRQPGGPPYPIPRADSVRWAAVHGAAAAGRAALDGTPESAFEAVRFADMAARDARAMDITARIRRDFECLHEAAVREGWTDDTAVGPGIFGPGLANGKGRLRRELETYARELPKLLEREGEFVLIHGDSIEGIWPTHEQASQAGFRRFGLEPFLVHRIQAVERPVRLG